jgi:cyclohexa-1,5-dienecarbonyl-CoA hydratase
MMREINVALNECAQPRPLAAIVFDAAEGLRHSAPGVAVEEHVPETVFQMLRHVPFDFPGAVSIAKPTLAVVDGPALGGGCELVAACDIVIARRAIEIWSAGNKARRVSADCGDSAAAYHRRTQSARTDSYGDLIDADEALRLRWSITWSHQVSWRAKLRAC